MLQRTFPAGFIDTYGRLWDFNVYKRTASHRNARRKNVGRVQVIEWAYVTVGRTKDASLGSRNLGGARHGWGAPCNRHGAPM